MGLDVFLGDTEETWGKPCERWVQGERNHHEMGRARSHEKLEQLSHQGGVICQGSLGKPGQGAINKPCSLLPLTCGED